MDVKICNPVWAGDPWSIDGNQSMGCELKELVFRKYTSGAATILYLPQYILKKTPNILILLQL